MNAAFIYLLDGLQYGLLIFLVAGGLSLLLAIARVVNLAHGAFYMLGAYLALSWTGAAGDVMTALLLGVPLAFLLGGALEWACIRFLYRRDALQQATIMFGLLLVFDETARLVWGSYPHSVAVPSFFSGSIRITETLSYPHYRLAVAGICILLAVALAAAIRNTEFGRKMRALRANPEMVEALGVDTRLLLRFLFAGCAALAAAAGIMAAPVAGAAPGLAEQILTLAIIAVLLGGIGSLSGVFAAALLVGVLAVLGNAYLPQLASVLVYAPMAALLVLRARPAARMA